MNAMYAELRWLPNTPEDFSARVKRLATAEGPIGREVQALASYALDLNQLTRLSKLIRGAATDSVNLAPLVNFRLGVLSNSTIDLTIPALIASAARHGLALDTIVPPYDQVAQQALTPDSQINTSHPDAVLFAIDYRALPLRTTSGDADAAAATVRGAMAFLETLRNAVRANTNAVCIFQTFAAPVETLFGSLDRALPGSLRNLLDTINRELAQMVYGSGDVLLDVASIAETIGLADWHSPELWNMGKIAFSCDLIPLYAEHVSRTIAALRGKSRKVLILDLDNTVWGGVIGDDGLEGIKVAQGDSCGEAHLAVQRMALDLRQRGIVLAVSSKNTDEVAREPFERHPEMLLKLEHIAVFQANWNDKATNIISIAQELSLGLDAMVFLDDNPVERGLIRSMLPQVAVPELPEDPALYARILAAGGYFEAVTFAGEDLKRAGFYQDNARRASLQQQVGGLDDYLAALDMTITLQSFDTQGRARIVQLINKSNQYNLTTRRYTEPEIDEVMVDTSAFTLQVRLADMFGDNGMISVVICRMSKFESAWEIDTWLMSCRVLGRKVEHMVLAELIKHARESDLDKLVGIYRPTDRNKLVVDHYQRLGFTKISQEDDGTTLWELSVSAPVPHPAPMKVISNLKSKSAETTFA